MKICAIVLDYRGATRTKQCLQSLNKQGISNLLIVDNSADKTASEKLDQAVRKLMQAGLDYSVKVIRPIENLGFARGINLALNDDFARQCDTYLLINNDAIASPFMVSQLLASLSSMHSGIVAPTIIDSSGNQNEMMWYQRHFGLITRRPLPYSFPYLSGCCLLFRRELLESNNLFDEDFFMYGEDTMLGWRLTCTETPMIRVEKASIHHENRGSSKEYKIFYEYHMARAHVLLAYKTYRTPLEIPALVLTKCIGLASRAMLRSIRARSMLPLIAFLFAWFPLKIRVP